jgi:hypothetical protein
MDQEFYFQQTGIDLSNLTDRQLIFLQAKIFDLQKTREQSGEWWAMRAQAVSADLYA